MSILLRDYNAEDTSLITDSTPVPVVYVSVAKIWLADETNVVFYFDRNLDQSIELHTDFAFELNQLGSESLYDSESALSSGAWCDFRSSVNQFRTRVTITETTVSCAMP